MIAVSKVLLAQFRYLELNFTGLRPELAPVTACPCVAPRLSSLVAPGIA